MKIQAFSPFLCMTLLRDRNRISIRLTSITKSRFQFTPSHTRNMIQISTYERLSWEICNNKMMTSMRCRRHRWRKKMKIFRERENSEERNRKRKSQTIIHHNTEPLLFLENHIVCCFCCRRLQ